jgi:hypothetical protein
MHHFAVPVIAVFTKYDQFRYNVGMDVLDYPDIYPEGDVSQVVQKWFEDYYLHPLGKGVIYVQLESEFQVIHQDCMLILLWEKCM